jgi:hypothetical protein
MLKTRQGPCGEHLVSGQAFREGDLVWEIRDSRTVASPTYQTIQSGRCLHLIELGALAFMNHSCGPNTVIDTSSLTVRAIRDIAAGEELTFFYPSTEWEMDRPFVCLCGAQGCIEFVAGARYLSDEVLRGRFINQHILELSALAAAE